MLILGVYKAVYAVSKAKLLSLIVAIVYLTVLNMTLLYGLGYLLEDWLPVTAHLHKLFHFPVILATIVLMLGLSYYLSPSLNTITKETKKGISVTPIVVYTAISVLVYLYSKFYDKIF